MRYYPGLGVGHHYCHTPYAAPQPVALVDPPETSHASPAHASSLEPQNSSGEEGGDDSDSNYETDSDVALNLLDESDDSESGDDLEEVNLSDIDEGELYVEDMYAG